METHQIISLSNKFNDLTWTMVYVLYFDIERRKRYMVQGHETMKSYLSDPEINFPIWLYNYSSYIFKFLTKIKHIKLVFLDELKKYNFIKCHLICKYANKVYKEEKKTNKELDNINEKIQKIVFDELETSKLISIIDLQYTLSDKLKAYNMPESKRKITLSLTLDEDYYVFPKILKPKVEEIVKLEINKDEFKNMSHSHLK